MDGHSKDINQITAQVFTIGHSNHSKDDFISLLKRHGIEVLVDVRSQPNSRYSSQFNYHELKSSLEREGIRYLFMGRELGGRPVGQGFYDENGFVLYSRIAESSLFKDGITRLERGMQQYRVALMCSEEDPSECHRRLLIGKVLADRNVVVHHIRADGTVQSEAQLAEAERGPQLALFDVEEPEEKVWKSTRSVSRKEAPPLSLES